jgi:hypothetical protein
MTVKKLKRTKNQNRSEIFLEFAKEIERDIELLKLEAQEDSQDEKTKIWYDGALFTLQEKRNSYLSRADIAKFREKIIRETN